jgi:hypothetical protein
LCRSEDSWSHDLWRNEWARSESQLAFLQLMTTYSSRRQSVIENCAMPNDGLFGREIRENSTRYDKHSNSQLRLFDLFHYGLTARAEDFSRY